MDKMGYEIIMEGLYTLRTEIKRDIALAYYDGEKDIYRNLIERMREIDDTIEDVRKKLNKLLFNGD